MLKPLKRSSPLFVLIFCATLGFAESTKEYIAPINPAATKETVNLYHFLQDIKGRHILSGQHNFIGKGSEFTLQLETLTGKSPVVWGSDFSFSVIGENSMDFQHAGPANLLVMDVPRLRETMAKMKELEVQWPPPPEFRPELELLDITIEEARKNTIEEIKIRHAQGHIITLMWHGCFPSDDYPCDGLSVWAEGNLPSDTQWEELTTEGTKLNNAWKKGFDAIAVHLKELQDNNIPVLWRPYHEMNGEWFWWGFKKGENGYKKLWLMTYEYQSLIFVKRRSTRNPSFKDLIMG